MTEECDESISAINMILKQHGADEVSAIEIRSTVSEAPVDCKSEISEPLNSDQKVSEYLQNLNLCEASTAEQPVVLPMAEDVEESPNSTGNMGGINPASEHPQRAMQFPPVTKLSPPSTVYHRERAHVPLPFQLAREITSFAPPIASNPNLHHSEANMQMKGIPGPFSYAGTYSAPHMANQNLFASNPCHPNTYNSVTNPLCAYPSINSMNVNHSNRYVPTTVSFPFNSYNNYSSGQHMPYNNVQNIRPHMNSDPLVKHILSKDLIKSVIEPFDGSPHKYNTWVAQINARIEGLNLSPIEMIHVMESNCNGAPKCCIQNFMSASSIINVETLNSLWQILYERFGSSYKISVELLSRLDKFPKVTGNNPGPQLEKFCDLLTIIQNNMQ